MLSKYAIALVAFLVYSLGVWHVSSTYSEASFNKERLEQAKEIIRIKDANAELATKLAGDVRSALDQYTKERYALTPPTGSVYSDCFVDDSVRQQYKRKLEAQRRLAN